MSPDIMAKITFYRTEDGGRQGPTPADKFGCLFEIDGEYFDCRLFLENLGSLAPGQTATVPIKFLRPESLRARLKTSQHFHLWDGKIVAEGEIAEIVMAIK